MGQEENKQVFSWLKTIREANMVGVHAMVATHSEPKSFDRSVPLLELETHASMKNYLSNGLAGEILAILTPVLGSNLEISWSFGPAVNAPAVKARAKKTGRVEAGLRDVANDFFLRVVSKEMGGRVILETITQE